MFEKKNRNILPYVISYSYLYDILRIQIKLKEKKSFLLFCHEK